MPIIGTIASSFRQTNNAYESIASVITSGGQTTVEFNSISNAYTHLEIRIHGTTANTTNWYLRPNGNSSDLYWSQGYGDGNNGAWLTAGYADSAIGGPYVNPSAASFTVFYISEYANTSKQKAVYSYGGTDMGGSGYINQTSGVWANSTAISSLLIYGAGAFTNGTYVGLYGIKESN